MSSFVTSDNNYSPHIPWLLRHFTETQATATSQRVQTCGIGYSRSWDLERSHQNTFGWPGVSCQVSVPGIKYSRSQCAAYCAKCDKCIGLLGAFNYHRRGGCRCYSRKQVRQIVRITDAAWGFCTVGRTTMPQTQAELKVTPNFALLTLASSSDPLT